MKIRGMVRPKGQRGSSWYCCLYRIRRLVGVRRGRGRRPFVSLDLCTDFARHGGYSEKRIEHLRGKVRTQNLWQLHLAGDWAPNLETKEQLTTTHLMRAMSAMAAVPYRDDNNFRTKLPECQIVIRIRYGATVDGKSRSGLQARAELLTLNVAIGVMCFVLLEVRERCRGTLAVYSIHRLASPPSRS